MFGIISSGISSGSGGGGGGETKGTSSSTFSGYGSFDISGIYTFTLINASGSLFCTIVPL